MIWLLLPVAFFVVSGVLRGIAQATARPVARAAGADEAGKEVGSVVARDDEALRRLPEPLECLSPRFMNGLGANGAPARRREELVA